jgi:hypothetical protein
MFDWFREVHYDSLYMRGKVSWPGIEREFDIARRMVGKERGWRVYGTVRRRRKREADLAAQRVMHDLEELGPEEAERQLLERDERRREAEMRRWEREKGNLRPRG